MCGWVDGQKDGEQMFEWREGGAEGRMGVWVDGWITAVAHEDHRLGRIIRTSCLFLPRAEQVSPLSGPLRLCPP